MEHAEIAQIFKELYSRLESCGLVLKINGEYFEVKVPNKKGVITYRYLEDLSDFVLGYELGYQSSLPESK